MDIKRWSNDRILWALAIIVIAYFALWMRYGIVKYQTYNNYYYDIGVYTYSLYWHLHYAANVGPLVYLSTFANHMSFFLPIVMLIFYFYQNPVTLYLVQGIFIIITTLLVYFVTVDLTNKRSLGFALSFAFFVNPAITGLMIFDSHYEAFIPFFYILAFYAYMKNRKMLFIVSLILLLSIMETTFALAGTLLVGLLLYEYFYARKAKSKVSYAENLKVLGIGVLVTIIFACIYAFGAQVAIKALSTTSYSTVPPIIRTINYLTIASTRYNLSSYSTEIVFFGFLGIVVLFLGFGASSLENPLITIVLILPWLIEVFLIRNVSFLLQSNQYYTNFIGPSYVAAMIGYLIISKNKQKLFGIVKIDPNKSVMFNPLFIVILALLIAGQMLFYSTAFSYIPYQTSGLNYTQINNAISMIPSNSSVLAQAWIAPHLYYIKNLEIPPSDNPITFWNANVTVYWFTPEYIIMDKYMYGYNELANPSQFNVYNYTRYNYTTIYNESGLYIFKRIN